MYMEIWPFTFDIVCYCFILFVFVSVNYFVLLFMSVHHWFIIYISFEDEKCTDLSEFGLFIIIVFLWHVFCDQQILFSNYAINTEAKNSQTFANIKMWECTAILLIIVSKHRNCIQLKSDLKTLLLKIKRKRSTTQKLGIYIQIIHKKKE